MSNETFRVSGKRFALPESDPQSWKLNLRPGGWIIAESPRGERIRLSFWEARGRFSANLGGFLRYGEVLSERRHGAGTAGGASDADLSAQFPGKVRKLLVQAGARVAAGDPMIQLEAMKMEFTVKAPFAGLVVRVLVAEGQQLAPGDRFFELTEASVDGGPESA